MGIRNKENLQKANEKIHSLEQGVTEKWIYNLETKLT